MDYERIIKNLLSTDIDVGAALKVVDNHYIGRIFKDKKLTFDTVKEFINKYENEIISCSLKDEALINNFLRKDFTVDRTKRNIVNQQYVENLINKIKKKEFDYAAITLYFYIINLLVLLAPKYDESSIRSILNSGIFPIVENYHIMSADGDTILSDEEKLKKIDVLKEWNDRFGTSILPNIFQLELLNKSIVKLLSSEQVSQNMEYKEKLESLLGLCKYSILIRDSDIVPTKEEVEKINNIFNEYNSINKSIIIDTLSRGDTMLVHFVRENDVNYQLVGNKIINSLEHNNDFDSEQTDFFIESYVENVITEIQNKLGCPFDLANPEIRKVLKTKLDEYNKTMNRRPLDRLPIKKKECGDELFYYIRKTDNRLSCSLISKDNPVSHLDRNIGLILRPKSIDAILSTSLGYTSERDYYDFHMDSVPSTEIFKGIVSSSGTNETCVDASKCEVIGVVVLSEDENIVNKAREIAQEYNV